MENDGKRTIRSRNVGIFFAKKEQGLKGFERRPKKKGKLEHRVSGSWNRQPEMVPGAS